MVVEDTTVCEGEDVYHLKKGGALVIANQAIHSDKAVWGEDADRFVATRFKRQDPTHRV